MSSAALVLLVVLGQVSRAEPPADPASLVRQLGAPCFADRQAAAAEIERLGSPALPALRDARQSRNMEIKTRAAALLLKIETALLTQPTSVRLDFDGASIADIAQSLSRQTGFKIALYPQNQPRWKNQRVKLHHPQELSFWKAIDELCDAASLQYNPGMQGFAGQQDQVFALSEGVIRTVTPVSDQGPFRVRLLGIDYQRRLTYVPSGSDPGPVPAPPRPVGRAAGQSRARGLARLNPVRTVHFAAQLVVAAEPRLSLAPRGELRLREAKDDHGNSLIDAGRHPQSLNFPGYFGSPRGSVMEIQAQLQRPADPGETIKILRGTIPVTVSSRRPSPLIVPLQKSAGKTFENSDVQVTVHDVRSLPDQRQTLVELSIRPSGPEAASASESDVYGTFFPRAAHHHLQIDVIDANDHLMSWFQSLTDAETSHITLTLTSSMQAAPPTELRYYSVARTEVDIPFEFSGIPMP